MSNDLLGTASAIFGIVGFLYGAYKEYFVKDREAQVMQLQSEVIILERKIAGLNEGYIEPKSMEVDLKESPSLEKARVKHLMHAFDRFQRPLSKYVVAASLLFVLALLFSGVEELGIWSVLSTLVIAGIGWIIFRIGRILLLRKVSNSLEAMKLTESTGEKLKIWINNEPWERGDSSTILARKVNSTIGL